jgi:hypothetical protein
MGFGLVRRHLRRSIGNIQAMTDSRVIEGSGGGAIDPVVQPR